MNEGFMPSTDEYDQIFPAEVHAIIPPLYTSEENPDPLVVMKFFTPDTNWTWYIIEGSPVDENGDVLQSDPSNDVQAVDFQFFGLVDGIETELGYISLNELRTIRGPLGLPIERDEHWKPRSLSEVESIITSLKSQGQNSAPIA